VIAASFLRLTGIKLKLMRLYMVRHGQTAWNLEERAQGHTDIPLDETGLTQAQCLADMLADEPIEQVLSSDLQRAMKTAEAIAKRLAIPVEPTPALRERSFGHLEGLPYKEVHVRLGAESTVEGLNAWHVACPPGGESMDATWQRVQSIAERLRSETKNTLVVSHGGTSCLLLAQLIAGTIQTARAFRFHNCTVTELFRRPDGIFQLIRFNDASHLSSAEPLKNAAIR